MKLRVSASLLAVALVAISVQAKDAATASGEQLVRAMRGINTLEMQYSRQHGSNLAELEQLIRWAHSDRENAQQADELTSALRGVKATVVVSGDRKHYQAFVSTASEEHCSLALFSNEQGLIYAGRPLGCK